MRFRPTAFATCFAGLTLGCAAHAQGSDSVSASSQFVLNATADLGQGLCLWGGAPYSSGAQILVPARGGDPHVVPHFYTCKGGVWTQE
jgi:hypothetical protein